MIVEIAEIFRVHAQSYACQYPVSREQRKAIEDIQLCRTAALGGHIEICDNGCGYARVSHHSCRNRHCPKCQCLRQQKWLQSRMERLLPTHYFHTVFTAPHRLNPLVLQNTECLYNLLFEAASQALLQKAKTYRGLGAQVGFTAVLHSWDQQLLLHPHVHIIVTGGGLHPREDRWISSKDDFFLPVKALSKAFRKNFLDALQEAFHQQKLTFNAAIQYLSKPKSFRRFIRSLRAKNWVVYCKKPFDGPQHAFAYVSRYTHRVAISNHRLVAFSDGSVTFRARDKNAPAQHRLITLSAHEFIKRFLLHVLPKGFVKIRHYGLLAPRNAKTRLEKARQAILNANPQAGQLKPSLKYNAQTKTAWQELMQQLTGVDLLTCPRCGKGTLIRFPLDWLSYLRGLVAAPVQILDSS